MFKIGSYVAVVLCIFTLAIGVSAQQQINFTEVQEQCGMIGKLVCAQVGITPEQQQDLKTVTDTLGKACQNVWASSDSDEVKVAQIQTLVDKAIPQALSKLTDQQKSNAIMLGVSLLTMQSSGSGFTISGTELAKMLSQTGLSIDKASTIIDVLRNHTEKAREIYANESLSTAAKTSQINTLRLGTLVQISGKLDSSEQKTMAAVLKAAQANCKTFLGCLNKDQQTKANVFGNQFMRFVEQMITISK